MRQYCGRHYARASSLCVQGCSRSRGEVLGVTRSAPAEERAHIVLRALSQNSTSVLESMNAASTTHLLLWHSAVVTPARLSDPHGELPADGGSQSSQRTTSGTGKTGELGSRSIAKYRQVIARAVQH